MAGRGKLRSAGLATALFAIFCGVTVAAAKPALRVCADPNNLPFSDREGRGFENKIAELVAADLGQPLQYYWWAERRGFLRKTLNAMKCDVVIGTPRLGGLKSTRPYYRSGYVWVSRADRHLDLHSIEDPRLRQLRIGVHLIGDDGANTPPAHVLGEQGIVDNVVGYMVYGDYRDTAPPSKVIDAVAAGDIDVAAVWGPLAGYFAAHASVPLTITPITDTTRYLPLLFEYPIGMGVRHSDFLLADRLDDVIYRRQADLTAILESYHVPLMGRGHRPAAARQPKVSESR